MAGKPSNKKNTHKKKVAVRVGVLSLSVILILVSVGMLYVHSLLNKIDRTQISGNSSIGVSEMPEYLDPVSLRPGESIPDSIQQISDTKKQYEAMQKVEKLSHKEIKNILLIGSDSRGTSDTGRSDSMILLSINTSTKKIHLTSLMRTMYVNIPGKMWFALNTAYAFGGPDLLVNTIEENFRIKIDDYMIINFTNFEKMIDLVDGIDIEMTKAEAKHMAQLTGSSYSEGVNHLNGAEALHFSRIRKIDTDFHRTGRQRQVMEALLHKALKADVFKLNQLAQEMLPLINTSMSNSEILSYASNAPSYMNYQIDQLMLPVENQPDVANQNGYKGMMYVSYGGISYEVWQVDYYTNVTALHDRIMS